MAQQSGEADVQPFSLQLHWDARGGQVPLAQQAGESEVQPFSLQLHSPRGVSSDSGSESGKSGSPGSLLVAAAG